MSEPLISCKDLSRHYVMGGETIKALDHISVDIHEGEFVAVMGPSGSGKSTFMNLCGALDQPTSGHLMINGRDLSSLGKDALADIRNRSIGFVFQQFNLLARTTAFNNVRLPLLYRRAEIADLDERCAEALALVDLSARAHHHPNELSGGQQQRVAIARALVTRPRIILADEPTGALDSHTGEEILSLFQDLNRRGMTIVMVTHDAQVASHARRRFHFLDGHLESDELQSGGSSPS